LIREAVKDTTSERHWIIFDGPVDAIWIENMNTVLDDNKKLCLNSGQILTLTPYMTMMFEVEDLEVASPATVSRCGMVYMEPGSLGMAVIYESWITRLPENIIARKRFVEALTNLFRKHLEPVKDFLRDTMTEMVRTLDNNLTQSLCNIIQCYLEDYRETEVKKVSGEELDILESKLGSIFFFALTWSFGCTGSQADRKSFDVYLRKAMPEVEVPSEKDGETRSVFDFEYRIAENKFFLWSDRFAGFEVDSKLQYHEVMVPTLDSTRNQFIIKLLLNSNFHVMTPGPTGTGKSMNLQTMLGKQMGEAYQYIAMTFSAQTGANQT